MVQPDMAAPYWAAAMFSTPEAVLALTVPDNAPTYVKAMWRYVRGVAFVSQGGLDDAANEIAAIQALEGEEDLAKAASAGIPGPGVDNDLIPRPEEVEHAPKLGAIPFGSRRLLAKDVAVVHARLDQGL